MTKLKNYFTLCNLREEYVDRQMQLKADGEQEKSHLVKAQIQSLDSMIRLEEEMNPDEVMAHKKKWFGGELE